LNQSVGSGHASRLYCFKVASSDPLIAVVDDELSVRTTLGRILRLADYQVTPFASGEDFLASLEERLPECAIFDVHMPGMSGLDLQLRIRAANIRIPAVFITASDDAALSRSAFEAGGICLVRKPFSRTELLAAVCTALRSGRRRP
jgi:FixJ family two-component response regulator